MIDQTVSFLFDLDGTLVDSVYQHVLAWHEALQEEGIELSIWRIHRKIGMSGGLFTNMLFRETGLEIDAARIERLRKGPEEDERLSRLTDQERRILDLIAEGLTNRQIAERMFLAEKTVKNYVSNLLAKLGMERRTEAAVFAARLASPLPSS